MTKEPTLIVMAAGMGSRYGGLKQVEKMTETGEIILDFSLYDAMMAGFKRVVFVIREEHRDIFRELVDERAGRFMEIEYAYQKLDDIPEGAEIPEGREKPWGTGHAIYACRELIDGPFAVINADDYYGPQGFVDIYEYLTSHEDDDKMKFCMAGYILGNTITENGHVARGVCEVTEEGWLSSITERTKILRREDGGIAFTEDEGKTWTPLAEETPVSMNFWGFTRSMMAELMVRFPAFLDEALAKNPQKAEYLLPGVVGELLEEDKARVKVLRSSDQWYGVTYKEDKQSVVDALQSMKDKGLYPEQLWK